MEFKSKTEEELILELKKSLNPSSSGIVFGIIVRTKNGYLVQEINEFHSRAELSKRKSQLNPNVIFFIYDGQSNEKIFSFRGENLNYKGSLLNNKVLIKEPSISPYGWSLLKQRISFN